MQTPQVSIQLGMHEMLQNSGRKRELHKTQKNNMATVQVESKYAEQMKASDHIRTLFYPQYPSVCLIFCLNHFFSRLLYCLLVFIYGAGTLPCFYYAILLQFYSRTTFTHHFCLNGVVLDVTWVPGYSYS